MWIKTKGELLVNTDSISVIAFDGANNSTVCVFNDDTESRLCDGNIIDEIADGIRRGIKVMEVN